MDGRYQVHYLQASRLIIRKIYFRCHFIIHWSTVGSKTTVKMKMHCALEVYLLIHEKWSIGIGDIHKTTDTEKCLGLVIVIFS